MSCEIKIENIINSVIAVYFRVYLKMDDSVMIKDFTNNNCIAVSGHVRNFDKTRMFSLHRDGIRVHHNAFGTLDIEIIDHNTTEYNDT